MVCVLSVCILNVCKWKIRTRLEIGLCLLACRMDQRFRDKNQSRHHISETKHLINCLPVKYQCSINKSAMGCIQHFVQALQSAAKPALVGSGPPYRVPMALLKITTGFWTVNSVFSPKQPLWCRWPRLGPWFRGAWALPASPPALLLSNAGWSRQPIVKMAPGRRQHAAFRATARPRAGEWS